MTKDATADEVEAADSPASWREQAVARSLDSARTRAENRVQRFLDAALELIEDGDDGEFTVQEVVERSGQSLRSFYQYFGGKHELLLALFEESVRSTADHLAAAVAEEDDAGERLHRFVVEYYRVCRPRPGGKAGKKTATPKGVPSPRPVLAEFAQQVLTTHPHDAARVFVPLVALCEELLADAAAAGALRSGVNRRSIAGTMLEVVMFNSFSTTIGGSPIDTDPDAAAEELWDLLLRGIGKPAG